MKKTRAGVALLMLALGVAAGVTWYVKSNGAQAVKPTETVLTFTPQEAAPARREALAQTLVFSGPLVAPRTATVRSQAGGTLEAVLVSEGAHVRAGQVLARVDTAELGARLAQQQAALAAAEAQLAQAQRTHDKNQRLADAHFIAPTALDGSLVAVDSARAAQVAAQAQVTAARTAARNAALLAPFSGIVAKQLAQPGERLAPEQGVITVVDLSRLEVAATVSVAEVGRLAPDMTVALAIDGVDAPHEGQIARIAPAADTGTRAIGVTVALANPGERLRAGQWATARVTLPGREPQLTVPIGALSSASGQDYVWTIEGGALVRRAVTTGLRDVASGRIEILTGLTADMPVLGLRFDNLREGAKARIAAKAV